MPKISDLLYYNKYDEHEIKSTGKISHCSACHKEIGKNENKAIINPKVKTRKYSVCIDCFQLLQQEVDKQKFFVMNNEKYMMLCDKYSYLIDEKPFEKDVFYVDAHGGNVFIYSYDVEPTIPPTLKNKTLIFNMPAKDKSNEEWEVILALLANLKDKNSYTVFCKWLPMVQILNQPYVEKHRKNEDLISFAHSLMTNKCLTITFKHK